MMQQIPTNYILPEPVFRAIAEYLAAQPYREVAHLMSALGALERLHPPQQSVSAEDAQKMGGLNPDGGG